MNKIAETYWVWTELTENLKPECKAGEPIWEFYRKTCPASWVAKGYVKEANQ